MTRNRIAVAGALGRLQLLGSAATRALVLCVPAVMVAPNVVRADEAPPNSSAEAEKGDATKTNDQDRGGSGADKENEKDGNDDRAVEKVVVTGSRLRGKPIGPVTTITSQDIKRSGAMSMRQVLATQPQFAGNGVNEATTAFQSTGGVRGATSFGTAANLRGLGIRSTLTLINGRRVAGSGQDAVVDVSQIPLYAIERIEVLTDGASAIYGADALAGVVNIVLRDEFEGAEVHAQAGTSSEGDHVQQLYGASLGGGWGEGGGRGSALLSYEWFDQQPLSVGDRPGLSAVNAPNNPDILPDQQRNSLFGTLTQSIGVDTNLKVLGFVSRRTTDQRSIRVLGVSDSVWNGDATTWATQGALSHDFSPDWRGEAALTWSKDEFQRTQVTTTYNSNSEAVSAEGSLVGEMQLWNGKPLLLALGGQYRREDFVLRSSSTALNLDAERDIFAAYAEGRVTLFGDVDDGEGYAELGAALRYDDYSNYGSSTSPKVGLTWRPLRSLQLSGTWGEGFRAPTFNELYGGIGAIAWPTGFYLDSASPTGRSAGPALQLSGGNPDLQAEKSESHTVSVDWSPEFIADLRTRLTYFDIDISDAIQAPPNNLDFTNPIIAPFVTRTPSAATVDAALASADAFFNLSGGTFSPANTYAIISVQLHNFQTLRAAGYDFDLSYAHEAGPGVFNAGIRASYLDDLYVRQGSATAAIVDGVGYPTSWRLRSTIGYDWSAWSAALSVNYVNSYENRINLANISQVDSWTTADLFLGFDASELGLSDFSAAFSVTNVTDEAPPHVAGSGTSSTGFLLYPLGYDPTNANAIGRYFSLRVSQRF